jgi:hypothetical protein
VLVLVVEDRVVGDVAPLAVGQFGGDGGAFVSEADAFEQPRRRDVAGIERASTRWIPASKRRATRAATASEPNPQRW